MKKYYYLCLSLLFLVLSACTTSNEASETSDSNQNNLESSISSMQDQIDALNDKLENATATTTTTTELQTFSFHGSSGVMHTAPETTTTKKVFEVPDVVGLTVKEAWIILGELDVSVGCPAVMSKDDYIVTSTNPPAGTIIYENYSITFEAEPPKDETTTTTSTGEQTTLIP